MSGGGEGCFQVYVDSLDICFYNCRKMGVVFLLITEKEVDAEHFEAVTLNAFE